MRPARFMLDTAVWLATWVTLLAAPRAVGRTPDEPVPTLPSQNASSQPTSPETDGASAAPTACGAGWSSALSLEASEKLDGAVAFWEDIFGEHDSGRVVLHDRDRLNVVWQVRELPRDADGRIERRRGRAATRRWLRQLRRRLRRLASDPTPRDSIDAQLLTVAQRHGVDSLTAAAARVRSQHGVADRFCEAFLRARTWFTEVCATLASEQVPVDLVALPFVESMYDPTARSHVGAAGLWQLMPRTARALGLVVSRRRDERLDREIATDAAARLLRQNYEALGSWPLAVTAYNHGPAGVSRGVRTVGSEDLADLIEHYDGSMWGFDSKNFYVELIAARNVALRYAEQSACPRAPSRALLASR